MEAGSDAGTLFALGGHPGLAHLFESRKVPPPALQRPTFAQFKERFITKARIQDAVRLFRTVRKPPPNLRDAAVFQTLRKCRPLSQGGEVIEFVGPRGKAAFVCFDEKSRVWEGEVKDPPEQLYANDNDCDTDSEVARLGTKNVLMMVQDGYEQFTRSVNGAQEARGKSQPTLRFNRAKSSIFAATRNGGAGGRQKSQLPSRFQEQPASRFELRQRGLWR